MKPRILCFVDYYIPGHKAGGPIRSIANMVAHLGSEIEFFIVTRDRDAFNTEAYSNVDIDQWNTIGNATVFYSSPSTLSFFGVMRLLKNTPHDLIYLNSFFSPKMTISVLMIRWLGIWGEKPIVIAPRGEFSDGAMALKTTRKRAYIALAKMLNLYRNLTWQASSEYEVCDIYRVMGGVGVGTTVSPNFVDPELARNTMVSPD